MAERSAQNIGRIEGMVTSIKESVDHLVSKIEGNGQKGIIERTQALEILVEAQCTAFEKDIETLRTMDEARGKKIDKLVESIESLTDSVNKHHGDKSQHTILGMLTFRALAVITLFVVAIVAIIPEEISIWELIRKLFGL